MQQYPPEYHPGQAQPPHNPYYNPGQGGGDFVPSMQMPMPTAPIPDSLHLRISRLNSPPLTEEEVRAYLQAHVESSCCHGKGPLEEMVIRDIVSIPVFRYRLETFTENRDGKWKTVPWAGPPTQLVGQSQNATPDIWDFVTVPNGGRFQKSKKVYELPNSVSVANCPRCQGSGRIQCNSCGGSGTTPCSSCCGMGYNQSTVGVGVGAPAMPEPPGNHFGHHHHHNHQAQVGPTRTQCTWCTGTGRSNCSQCHRRGIRTCSSCEGNLRIKTYYEVNVNWNTTIEECVSVASDLNSKYRKYFKRGDVLFTAATQESAWSRPLDSFPDERVVAASRSMLEGAKRTSQSAGQRIIEFRQTVYEIPATKVQYGWKGKEDLFLLCGMDNTVEFPNSYPQSCCTIL